MPAEPLAGSTIKVGRNHWHVSSTTLTRDDSDTLELSEITKVRLDIHRKYLVRVEAGQHKFDVLARTQKTWRPFVVRLLRHVDRVQPDLRIHRREGSFTIWWTFAVMLFLAASGCYLIGLGLVRPDLPGTWVGWLFLVLALPGLWLARPWNADRHYSSPREIADAFEMRGVSLAMWHLHRDAVKRTRR